MEIPQKLDKNRGVEGKINTDGGGLNGLKRGGVEEEEGSCKFQYLHPPISPLYFLLNIVIVQLDIFMLWEIIVFTCVPKVTVLLVPKWDDYTKSNF